MKDRILLRNRPVARRWVLGIFLTLVAIMLYGVAVVPRQLSIVNHDIALRNLPSSCENTSIDFVADTHTGALNNGVDNLDRVVNMLIKSDSKVVLLGGDYVILSVLGGTYVSSDKLVAHLKPLTRAKPVYAVLGNHDWWKNGPDVTAHLREAGITVLEDESREINVGPCKLWVAGIGDLDEARHDIPKTFSTIPNDATPVIALTHNPMIFPQIPVRAELTLAGHTHGGQINLPVVGSPAFWFKHGQHSDYVNGLYSKPNGQQMFVTPGIGTSIMPMRLGVPPEISKLTLKKR